MMKKIIILLLALGGCLTLIAGPYNIAPKAKVTASSERDSQSAAQMATNGIIGVENQNEWASASGQTSWGAIEYPWIQLDWDEPQSINRVILYDRPIQESHVLPINVSYLI